MLSELVVILFAKRAKIFCKNIKSTKNRLKKLKQSGHGIIFSESRGFSFLLCVSFEEHTTWIMLTEKPLKQWTPLEVANWFGHLNSGKYMENYDTFLRFVTKRQITGEFLGGKIFQFPVRNSQDANDGGASKIL